MTGFQTKRVVTAAKLNEDWINLRDQVLEQIVRDVKDGDLTAIEELLVYCTEDAMRQYLPE
jgi:hypothetical protein